MNIIVNNEMRNLLTFVVVAETKSFTLAAKKLNLTRSSISKIISRLEGQLNIMLFRRTTRYLKLTMEGEIFFKYCKRAISEINNAELLLNESNSELKGTLKISLPIIYGRYKVMPIIKKFIDDFPKLKIEIYFKEGVGELTLGEYDIAITTEELNDSSTLMCRRVEDYTMLLCASPEYLEKNKKIKSIEDLSEHKLINYTPAGIPLRWRFKENNKFYEYPPNSTILMDDMQSILDLLIDSKGVGWLPSWLVHPYLENGSLIELLSSHRSDISSIKMIWGRNLYTPLKVRLFLDYFIKELYKEINI
ncbi:LysR family transcriptional regulator [Acinetobacter lactucae]|uniref:LysR family transcriptional regulator n=1 Tax=Acinetobacter lactucae TaxID=1785128 RepID=UPI0021CDD60D|nr:LysR family transcriptional regulator [Acinetobacter lactucae]MCU4346730.1 LysR family transcriptional regulator [Acinetobacter lactucae]